MSIPRNDYPRPQWRRDDWLCLNGDWQFERDPADTGLERGLVQRELAQRIVVPFCPESPLSGIDNPDHHLAVWYRRQVAVPADWRGRRVLLHFQAVDEDCTAWIDGQEIGRHEGGTTPFAFDITDHIAPGGEGTLVVRARDDHRQDKPKGKLRILYEGAPMGMIIEQAGGRASTGTGPLLEVEPTGLHERTPVYLGSVGMVEWVEGILSGD